MCKWKRAPSHVSSPMCLTEKVCRLSELKQPVTFKLKGNFDHNSTGALSPTQTSHSSRRRLFSKGASLAFSREPPAFSKWKRESKDPEQERESQQTFSPAVNGGFQHHGQSKSRRARAARRKRDAESSIARAFVRACNQHRRIAPSVVCRECQH